MGKTKEPEIRKVFISSPFRPKGASEEEREKDIRKNIRMAQAACKFAIGKGCVPYAPHLYFPQFLSEDEPDEREMGMLLGITWLARCDELWVIGDRISEGMAKEIEKAKEWNIPIRHFAAKKAVGRDLTDLILMLMEGGIS